MKSCFFKKIGAAFIAVVMIAVSAYMPAFAATDKIQVIFTDVTATDPTTLSGEAKIMVSVKGVSGEATIAQMALEFSGNLKYKSINFLKGENNPDEGSVIFCQSAAVANNNLKITPSIICPLRPITFSGEQEDLFVLTFAGNAGDKVKLTLDDIENTYCEIDGNMYYPSKRITTNNTYTGSKDANNGKEAGVKLVMDVVTDFKAIGSDGANKSAVVNLKITSENAESKGYTIVTELSNTAISKGGHRDGSASIPTFVINNIVLDNSTYTVELSGIGYVPYKATGVTFDEVLEITNADFIPGDVDADEDVDGADKAAWYEIYESGEYNEAADFNRDGKINMYDITSDGKSVETVYAGIELPDDDEEVEENQPTVPAKMNKPTLSGGNGKISVKWKQPSDGGSAVTGYIIKYGTSTSNLNRTKEITKADATSATIDDLSDGAKYYVAIAAKNAVGTGEFSDTASATTDSGSDDSGGGGGGGGGGGSVGGGVVGGTTVVPGATVTPGNNANLFTDLGEHQWAQEAVYALRDAGIINGVTATIYSPATNIKRGDFILILTRMLSLDGVVATDNFSDVPAGSYYYDAIAKAKAAGIAKGSGNMFHPEESITRQDLITLAYRAFAAQGYIEETSDFSSLDVFNDKTIIADYATAPMASMVRAGIIKGDNGNVNPQGNATRAEVAVMCNRLRALIK